MIKVNGAGRAGAAPSTPAASRSPRTGSGFGAALDATREEANTRPQTSAKAPDGRESPSLEELKEFGQLTDLDKLRLEAGHERDASGTLADQCRAALDALDVGNDCGSARECLRRTYEELVRATEADYGHLPHDSLPRILAMAEKLFLM